MPNFIIVNIIGNKTPIYYSFVDCLPVNGNPGKSAVEKIIKFLAACVKYESFECDNNVISANEVDGEGINADHFDLKDGGTIEPDKVSKKNITVLNSTTGDLSYRSMQVIWCELFLDMTIDVLLGKFVMEK